MKLTTELVQFIESQGWTMECESPLEFRHEDGSFASQQAANRLVDSYQQEMAAEKNIDHDTVVFDYVDIMSELNYLNQQLNMFVDNTPVVNDWNDDSYENCQHKMQWGNVYSLVFNKNMNKRVSYLLNEMNNQLDYYDPDMTEQDDVLAFYRAFNEKMELLNKIFQPKEGYTIPKKNIST